MTALTDTAENRTLDWLTGNTTTAPVLPLMVRLMTGNGTDSTAGTQVVGGSYAPQPADFSVSSGGQSSNEFLIRFDNMPDVPNPGVVGFEIWDSAATPIRWWRAPLTTPRTYVAGDAAEFPQGELVLSVD